MTSPSARPGGSVQENPNSNVAYPLHIKPNGSTLVSTRCFLIVRQVEIPALLVTKRLHRFKIGSALSRIPSKEKPNRSQALANKIVHNLIPRLRSASEFATTTHMIVADNQPLQYHNGPPINRVVADLIY